MSVREAGRNTVATEPYSTSIVLRRGPGQWVVVECEDVDAVCEALQAAKAEPHEAPKLIPPPPEEGR